MNLTNHEWEQVRKVAYRTVMAQEQDHDLAEEIADMVILKLLELNPEVEPGALNAYVAQAARRLFIDELRRRQRRRIDPVSSFGQEDEADFRLIVDVALHAKSPSVLYMKSERVRRQVALVEHIVGTLSDKQRQLLEMTANGLPHARIAEELGYASAGSVDSTLSRLIKRLRREFEENYSPSLFTTGDTAL